MEFFFDVHIKKEEGDAENPYQRVGKIFNLN